MSTIRCIAEDEEKPEAGEPGVEKHEVKTVTVEVLKSAIKFKCCVFWSAHDAPTELLSIVHQGGDEDYIWFCPVDVECGVPCPFTASGWNKVMGHISKWKVSFAENDSEFCDGYLYVGTHS